MQKKLESPVKGLLWPVFACCISMVAGCGESTDRTQHMTRAEQQFENAHYGEAIVELKHALEIANDEQRSLPRARWMLGMSYLRTGDMRAAAKELVHAKELGWNPDDVLPSLAKALLRSGEMAQVMELSTAGLDPQVAAKLQVYQALALLDLGDIWTADTYITKAAELRPNDIEVQIAKARILGASGDIEGALAAIELALEAQPGRRDAWIYKGDLLSMQQKLPEALVAFDAAIKLFPRDAEVRLKRGLINLHLQRLKRVVPDLNFLLGAASKSPSTSYLQGSLHFLNGRYAQSITPLTLARPAAQQYPLILFYLAGAYLAVGNEAEALRQAERQVDLNPNFAPGRILLASIYVKQSNARDAQRILQPVLDTDPTNSLTLNIMAKALMLEGRTDQALRILEKLQQLEPESPIAHYELGVGLLSDGQDAAANRHFEAALALDPTLEQAAVLRIQHLNDIQDFSKALTAAQDYVQHHPESVLAHNLLGQNYLANGQVDNAIAAFDTALSLAPGDPVANHALALIEQDRGNTQASRAHYQAVLAKRPDYLPTLLHLAVLAAEPGNEADMVAQLQYAIEAHPDALEPKLMLARYYIWENTPSKTPALFATLPESKQQSPEVLRLLAISHIAEQQYSKALYHLEHLLNLEPDTALLQHLLATAAAGTGDLDKARAALERAEELDENFPPALVSLAWLAWADNNQALFNRYLQRLNTLAPDSLDVLRLQAVAAQRDGKTARAIELSRQVMASAPETVAMLELAGFLQMAGSNEEALQMVQDWVSEYPDDIEARMALATQLEVLGLSEDAIRQYREVVKRQPQNVTALNILAQYLRGERVQQAQAFSHSAFAMNQDKAGILGTLAQVESEIGSQEETLTHIKREIAASPNSPGLFYHQAMIEVRSGNRATAIDILKNVLGTDNVVFTEKQNAEQLLASLHTFYANAR
tara:strand:+ start:5530 stop:8349 length:2820 start_codon:yes stop_codon:yes gene_type:complete